MLRRGVIFSIFWLMGVGSLIAIIQAMKARKIIRQSSGEIRGSGKVMVVLDRWRHGFVVLGLRDSNGRYKGCHYLIQGMRRK